MRQTVRGTRATLPMRSRRNRVTSVVAPVASLVVLGPTFLGLASRTERAGQ
jgi:hypothetical protein